MVRRFVVGRFIIALVCVSGVACSVELQDKEEAARPPALQVVYGKEEFVVSGVHILKEDLRNFRRITFLENATLVTEGRDLEIQAQEVVSASGARILSFLSPAALDQPGSPAGHLRLRLSSLEGSLAIHMIGQEGGPGSSGAPYTERAAQGFSPPSFPGFSFGSCDQAQPGGRGVDGSPGRDGLQGKIGGDGGFVEVFTTPEVFAKLNIRVDAGLGGVGGRGGPGQPGGLGGVSQSGRVLKGINSLGEEVHETCTPKLNQGEGVPGVAGRDGQKGPDGKTGAISFQP